MASGIAYSGLTDNDASKRHPLLDKVSTISGDEFIYLQGLAGTTAGSVVTYTEAGITALITANAIGPVAVAKAATVANEFGWYQIAGTATCNADTVVADAACYIDGTDGRIDDAVVAGDLIRNMTTQTATASGQCTVTMNYPNVLNV